MLTHKAHPEAGFRAAMGLRNLASQYGAPRLEAVAERACAEKLYHLDNLRSILATRLYEQPLPQLLTTEPAPIQHDNLRGADYFRTPAAEVLEVACVMLTQQTIEKLRAMRLRGLAEAYQRQLDNPETAAVTFDERLAMLVDQQTTWRENLALQRRLKTSKLDAECRREDVNYRHARHFDSAQFRALLADSQWVARHHTVLFTHRPSGHRQKLARASAGQPGLPRRVLYRPAGKLFRKLGQAQTDGSVSRLVPALTKVEVLVVDDFAMNALGDHERRLFLEICDDRYRRRSTVLASQLPVNKWHQQIGDPTVADSILDRLVHQAYRFEFFGESLRKTKGGRP